MTEILVLNGKHGDYHYKADTDEAKKEAALKIVSLHLDIGYYYNPGKFEDTWGYKHYSWADILKSEEEISKLETDEERVEARKKLKTYLRDKQGHEEAAAFHKEAKRIVEEKDGKAAWGMIWDRQDNEYEGIQLETLQ